MDERIIARLIEAGFHLVPCNGKVPNVEGWQISPWDGTGDYTQVGHIPGRAGWCNIDVDIPKDTPPHQRPIVLAERIDQVVEQLGPPALRFQTPSGGAHLYYRFGDEHPTEYPNGTSTHIKDLKLTIGDVRCDSGQAVLWGDTAERLLQAHLDPDSVQRHGRSWFLEELQPLLKGSASATPGLDPEGTRNDALNKRIYAAMRNDPNPEPAIRKARAKARASGLGDAEVGRTERSARSGGAKDREKPPPKGSEGLSEVDLIVKRWKEEHDDATVSQECKVARGAQERLDATIRGDTSDPVAHMRLVAKVHAQGGEEAVRAMYREQVAGALRSGVSWDAPEEPEWFVPGWIPRNRLAFLYAHGGVGKSQLGTQLALAAATGGAEWLPGSAPGTPMGTQGIAYGREPVKVLFGSWEDDERSMRRMLKRAAATLGVEQEKLEMAGIDFIYAGDLGALWAPDGKRSTHIGTLAGLTEGGVELTGRFGDYGLVILDPLAAVYASEENVRGLVRAFISAFDGLAQRHGCTLLILGHSSAERKASGSTDWVNGVRCVLLLEHVYEKEQSEHDKRRYNEVFQGVRLSVHKLNEGVKPPAAWVVRDEGWRTCTRATSAEQPV